MGNRSVRRPDLDPKVLADKICSLLANKERRRVGVCAQIVRTDTQVDTLQVLGTIDIEAMINNTSL
jgi:exoribonuclease II